MDGLIPNIAVTRDKEKQLSNDELGQWDVDVNGDATGVVLDFTHFNENGIETFQTALPREQALSLATAILNAALTLPEDQESNTND